MYQQPSRDVLLKRNPTGGSLVFAVRLDCEHMRTIDAKN